MQKRIVFAEGDDERILKAASIIVRNNIAEVILLGDIDKILGKLGRLKLKFNVSVINPKSANKKHEYAKKFYELRKNKGIDFRKADKIIEDPNYFACMMLHENACDAALSGAVYSTPEILKPAFQIIKTRKNVRKASGAIMLKIKGRNYLFADCSVQENPDSADLAEIARLSAKTFKKLTGENARVAMLSYHTLSKWGNSEFFEKSRKAAAIVRKAGISAFGEIQLDAALLKNVAKRKNVKFIDANVLIFSNLDAGNIGYKLAWIFANPEMTGVIIQGLSKPVNDMSRGASIDEIVRLAKATVKQIRN